MALADYIEDKPVLRTERLTLRQLLPSDIPALKEWILDKRMYTYWGKPAGKQDKNPELLFENAKKKTKSFHWGIALNEDDKAEQKLLCCQYMTIHSKMNGYPVHQNCHLTSGGI